MRGKWTKGEWRLAELHAIGMYGNDGAAVILAGDPADASLVANVAAHAKFKRGQGHGLANDPERDANARLIAAAPALYEALERAEAALRILSEELPATLPKVAKFCAADAAVCRAALSLAHTEPSQGE